MKLGKVTENVQRRSILNCIQNRREEVLCGASVGTDRAVFAIDDSGTGVIVTGSAQGTLTRSGLTALLHYAANAVYASGAEPFAVQLGLLLPETAGEPQLKAYVAEAETVCAGMNMQLAEAQASVLPELSCPTASVTVYGRYASAAALQEAREKQFHTARAARPGQEIVITRQIALEGTALLAASNEAALLERYPAWLARNAEGFGQYLSIKSEAAPAIKSGACAILNMGEGGVLAALWELADGADAGLNVDMRKLPLRQETVEVCELCGANPYELLSGGSLVITCGDGAAMTAALAAEGIPATVVGRLADGNARVLTNGDEVRYLDRPHTDAILEQSKSKQEAS